MARMPRVVVPYYSHHVTQRGNRRQQTFFCIDDYRCYLELVSEFASQTKTEVWACCLMSNHVHLVRVPSIEDGLRATLGETHRRYIRYINFRKGWRGHFWQERFHSFFMDEKYLMATVRYVERNTIVEKLCKAPQDWKWSSARAHLEGRDDTLVRVRPMLDLVSDWQLYLSENIKLDEVALIKRHGRTGRPLGQPEFVQKLETLTGRTLGPVQPGPQKGKK